MFVLPDGQSLDDLGPLLRVLETEHAAVHVLGPAAAALPTEVAVDLREVGVDELMVFRAYVRAARRRPELLVTVDAGILERFDLTTLRPFEDVSKIPEDSTRDTKLRRLG